MKWFPTPLYWRLLTWFCAANLLVLLLGGAIARRYIAYTTTTQLSWATLAGKANQAYEAGGRIALATWLARERRQGIDATLFAEGRPLYPIHLPPKIRAQIPAWLAVGQNSVRQPWPKFYVAIQQVSGSDGTPRQLLAMSHSRPHLQRLAQERIFLSVQLAMSLLFIGVVGWWVARSVARPVEALRGAARRMAQGELSVRVGRQGRWVHEELARLAGDFDTMAGRIEALVAHDRNVLQDLSHELRSPLARLQLTLDLARSSRSTEEAAPYFQQAEQEIGRLDEMLDRVLSLSRMERGLPGVERESVDLANVVHDCLERCQLEAGQRNVEFHLGTVSSAMVQGSPSLLERAVDNLLSNALKFSAEDTRVDVSVHCDHAMAEVVVRDHGPGVPSDELPRLFQPFFRGSNAKRADGHGLGLAIVRRVAHVHNGSVDARNAAGGGLEVRLRLPLCAAGLP